MYIYIYANARGSLAHPFYRFQQCLKVEPCAPLRWRRATTNHCNDTLTQRSRARRSPPPYPRAPIWRKPLDGSWLQAQPRR